MLINLTSLWNLNMHKMSDKGLDMLIKSEGLRLKKYKDSVGKWTIGVGHLITGKENPPIDNEITKERCEQLLSEDLKRFENCVNESVKIELTQNEFDSLVHFSFNIGTGAFRMSTLVKLLNRGLKKEASDQFLVWTKQKELTGRRLKEKQLFLEGVYA